MGKGDGKVKREGGATALWKSWREGFTKTELLTCLAGALFGGGIAYLLSQPSYGVLIKILVGVLVGALVGLVAPVLFRSLDAAYHYFNSAGRSLKIESFPVRVPGLGEIKVILNEAHRTVGWKLFIEATTRIIMQPLGRREGLIREALTSMYDYFKLARTELKAMTASPPPPDRENEYTVETYVVRMLNEALRPCMARWHPRLKDWEATGLPESLWPLKELCRRDMETARLNALSFVYGLGNMLRICEPDKLLFSYPGGEAHARAMKEETWQMRQLVEETILEEAERGLKARPSPAQIEAGWRVFVELASRLQAPPAGADRDFLRRALSSMEALREVVRRELKQMHHPLKAPGEVSGEVGTLLAGILNGPLGDFLAVWHPRFQSFDQHAPTADAWPRGEECLKELGGLIASLKGSAASLGKALGLGDEDVSRYLPAPPRT